MRKDLVKKDLILENSNTFIQHLETLPAEDDSRLTAVQQKNQFCETILHFAIRNDHPIFAHRILLLLPENQRINAIINDKTAPLNSSVLYTATANKNPDMFSAIFETIPKESRIIALRKTELDTFRRLMGSNEKLIELFKLTPEPDHQEAAYHCLCVISMTTDSIPAMKIILSFLPTAQKLTEVFTRFANLNNIEKISWLIQFTSDQLLLEILNEKDSDGNNFLQIIASSNDVEKIFPILAFLPEPVLIAALDEKHKSRRSILSYVLEKGNFDMVSRFLTIERIFSIAKEIDFSGKKILYYAGLNPESLVFNLIQQCEPDVPTAILLHLAARNKNPLVMYQLVLSLSDNIHTMLKVNDSQGNNVLHILAESNNSRALQTISNPVYRDDTIFKAKNNAGHTPLEVAVLKNSLECLEYILKFYPEENDQRLIAAKPFLPYAIQQLNIDMLSCILSALPQKNRFDVIHTMLKTALDSLQLNEVETLIATNNLDGYSILHYAIMANNLSENNNNNLLLYHIGIQAQKKENHFAIFKAFFDVYPKDKILDALTAENKQGKTALHLAIECGNIEILKTVLATYPTNNDCFSAIEKKNNAGSHALHLAVSSKPILEILINVYTSKNERARLVATLNQKNNTNESVLSDATNKARGTKNTEVIEIILEKYTDDEKSQAILEKSNFLKNNLIYSSFNYPPIFKVILKSLPEKNRLRSLTEENDGNTYIHAAASKDDTFFNIIFELVPHNRELFDFLKKKNPPGESVLDYVKKRDDISDTAKNILKPYELLYQLELDAWKPRLSKKATWFIQFAETLTTLEFTAGDVTFLSHAIVNWHKPFALWLATKGAPIIFSIKNAADIIPILVQDYYPIECVDILKNAKLALEYDSLGLLQTLYMKLEKTKNSALIIPFITLVQNHIGQDQQLPKWITANQWMQEIKTITPSLNAKPPEREKKPPQAMQENLALIAKFLDDNNNQILKWAKDSENNNILQYIANITQYTLFSKTIAKNIFELFPKLKPIENTIQIILANTHDYPEIHHDLFKIVLNAYPEKDRLAALSEKNKKHFSVLDTDDDYKHSVRVRIILESLSDQDRLKAIVVVDKFFNTFLCRMARKNSKAFDIILELIMDKKALFTALKAIDNLGHTNLSLAKDSSLLQPYKLLYHLETPSLLTTAAWLKTEANNCNLNFAAGDITIFSHAILYKHINLSLQLIDKFPLLILSKENINSIIDALASGYYNNEDFCIKALARAEIRADIDFNQFEPLIKMAQQYKYDDLQDLIMALRCEKLPRLAWQGFPNQASVNNTTTTVTIVKNETDKSAAFEKIVLNLQNAINALSEPVRILARRAHNSNGENLLQYAAFPEGVFDFLHLLEKEIYHLYPELTEIISIILSFRKFLSDYSAYSGPETVEFFKLFLTIFPEKNRLKILMNGKCLDRFYNPTMLRALLTALPEADRLAAVAYSTFTRKGALIHAAQNSPENLVIILELITDKKALYKALKKNGLNNEKIIDLAIKTAQNNPSLLKILKNYEFLYPLETSTYYPAFFTKADYLENRADDCDLQFSAGDITFLSQGILNGHKKFALKLIGRKKCLIVLSDSNIKEISAKLAYYNYDEAFCLKILEIAKFETNDNNLYFLEPLCTMAQEKQYKKLNTAIATLIINAIGPQQQPPEWLWPKTNTTVTISPQNDADTENKDDHLQNMNL